MNFINKILKVFNKRKYYENKYLLKVKQDRLIFENKIKNELQSIESSIKEKNVINFLHSGHCGDLIYSLPLIKKLSKTHKCNLLIGLNKKLVGDYYKHPAKDVFIDERMYNLVLPLLKNQKFINEVKKKTDELADINLDLFRDFPFSLSFNSLKWYSHIAGEILDLKETFLESTEHSKIKNKIVIVRSFRARNHLINYNFLNNYDEDYIFIGLKNEFDDLKKEVSRLIFYETRDFFEMAQIIKSSKFFIGNQSLAFSIAEGLKVPRLLENRLDLPVVQPFGGKCFDFYFQIHFEKYFDIFYRN